MAIIMAAVFKTQAGASKHCRFENRHSIKHTFTSVRYRAGREDTEPFLVERDARGEYTWRLHRELSLVKRLANVVVERV